MEFKRLGSTGEMVPEIGLGTWKYSGDPEVIRRSLELGGSHIDTAENYHTEERVGRAIRGGRADYFIATKVSPGNLAYKDVIKAAEGSMKRLGTDHIDLYQVHWPNPRIPIEDTMRAMEELLHLGRVRYVGVSNFSVQQLQEAQQALGAHPVVSNQVSYSLFDRAIERDLLPYCGEHQVTVVAYSPLAMGRMDSELRARPRLTQVLDEVGAATGKTRAQVLLAWCVNHPQVITIPQTNRVHRVEENCAASGWRLTPEQYAALSEAAV